MQLFAPDPRPIHFMGIAGAGMSALALIALRRGVVVTGCDVDPRGADELTAAGVDIGVGHDPRHVEGARAVIHTAAVPSDHPELEAARLAGIPVWRRANALGELVSPGKVVGVAGTHGKTTVTAMLTDAAVAAGFDPTGLVGGRVGTWNGNARLGGDELFVVEADEYDKSFLALTPNIAIINNVEADHLECYGSLDDLEAAFVEFSNRAELAIIGADDNGAGRVAALVDAPVWRVGTARDADVHIGPITPSESGTTWTLTFAGGDTVNVELVVPGFHNARNAAMAIATVEALGGDPTKAADALGSFSGVGRRFELLGEHRGVTIVDDYAHHPSEVVATLAAARQRFAGRRIIAVFQPHLYSRTRSMGSQFGVALSVADIAVVTDVYPAREAPIKGVTGEIVVRAARRAGAAVEWIPDKADLVSHLERVATAGDVVITLGAGDITDVGPALIERLTGRAA